MSTRTPLRPDLRIIADLIAPAARVLDLGCGRGELLAYLQREKNVVGYGLEKEADNITQCIHSGVSVLEQDLDQGLANFPSNSFDIVVMTETLQAVRHPGPLLDDMLRIGAECVVTFPNFAYWRCRYYLTSRGRMPVVSHLPHQWYDTPNIHLCTFADFEALCMAKELRIIERFVVDKAHDKHPLSNRFPNLFGAFAFYRLGKTSCIL